MNHLRPLWNWLVGRVEFLASLFLPVLFLIIDILIRIGFEIGISDAGADMCMAAIAARVCSLLTHAGASNGRRVFYGDVLLIGLYCCLWILCLLLVSRIPENATQLHGNAWAVWIIGFVVLFTALYRTLLEVRNK